MSRLGRNQIGIIMATLVAGNDSLGGIFGTNVQDLYKNGRFHPAGLSRNSPSHAVQQRIAKKRRSLRARSRK